MSKSRFGSSRSKSGRLHQLAARIARSGSSDSHGVYQISKSAAARLAAACRRGLPRSDDEFKIATGTHRAWKNSTKRDPGWWMLGREGDQYVLTFVFEDW